jgi:translation initiation factor IF-3
VIFIGKRFIINEQIRGTEVRLIDENGVQAGIISLPQALEIARGRELDLILIAPDAKPPVCKIGDIGKLKYEASKKEKENKKGKKTGTLKEIKLTPKIEAHDLNVKINKTIELLEKGHKVKLNMFFRGREMSHKDIGFKLVEIIIEKLAGKGAPEAPPKMEGRNLNLIVAPV